MNEKVKAFISQKAYERKAEAESKKKKILLNLDLYEKVYSPDNSQTDEYTGYEYDEKNDTARYYKKVPIEVTDDEYQQILKYAEIEEPHKRNTVSIVLLAIAWVIFIGGFIAGIALGTVTTETGTYYSHTETVFSIVIAFAYWCVSFISGTIFLGFSEIIRLLDEIRRK